MIKQTTLQIVLFGFAALLLLGCNRNKPNMNNPPEEPRILGEDDAVSLFCWYVEDDGTGHDGYATMDGRISAGWPRGGGLFGTIKDVRNAIKRQKIKTPWLIPYCPAFTPRGWKIRGLTTNEVEQLGLSANCKW